MHNNLINTLNNFAQDVINIYKSKLQSGVDSYGSINATHNLENSLRYEVEETDDDITVYIWHEEYAGAIDLGRQPTKHNGSGLRPKIEEWITVKGIQPKPNAKTGKIPTIKQLSFMITKTIHEEGTRFYKMGGTNIFKNSVQEALQKWDGQINDAMMKDADEMVIEEVETFFARAF